MSSSSSLHDTVVLLLIQRIHSEIYDFADEDPLGAAATGAGLAGALDESLDAFNEDTFDVGGDVGE